jgi:hypothetical protein
VVIAMIAGPASLLLLVLSQAKSKAQGVGWYLGMAAILSAALPPAELLYLFPTVCVVTSDDCATN